VIIRAFKGVKLGKYLVRNGKWERKYIKRESSGKLKRQLCKNISQNQYSVDPSARRWQIATKG